MATFEAAALLKVPYIDTANLHGRFVSSLTFYDQGCWRMWLPADSQLFEIKGEPAEAFYFSAEPASPFDICFRFLDFVAQRVSFADLQKPIQGMWDDIFNLSACLAKISHLHECRTAVGHGISRMVVTEVEYLFYVCRSIFDLLQEIIRGIWQSIRLHDSSLDKRPLRETFSKMVLFEKRLVTVEELVNKFGLPQQLAAFYLRSAKFFLELKEFRDAVVHRGSQIQTIFASESGFLVQQSLRPFSTMQIWRTEERQSNDLVPLFPALALIAHDTLCACEDFASTIETIIQFPPPIVPGMNFYMRGYFNSIFVTALSDAGSRVTARSDADPHAD